MIKQSRIARFTSVFVGLGTVSALLLLLSIYVIHNENGAVVAAIMLAASIGVITTGVFLYVGKQLSNKYLVPMAIANLLLFTVGTGVLLFSWLNNALP